MKIWIVSVCVGVMVSACGPGPAESKDVKTTGEREIGSSRADAVNSERVSSPNPMRNAYFGDTHVHTAYSFDAFIFGTTASPDASYNFAKGEPLLHPAGFEMRLDRPLDFQAVADHAMYLGMLPGMTDPESPAYAHPEAARLRDIETVDDISGFYVEISPYLSGAPGTGEYLNEDVVKSAWEDIIESANRHNDPGRFTAFVAYEYTSAGGARDNLHRNIIFRGDSGPDVPFSRLTSHNPEELWAKMEQWRAEGMDSLAIPHNSNGSGGRMFERTYYDGAPIDSAYSELRMRNEPLVEITQVKGTSETHPALSPNDEWAGFEIMPYRIASNALSGVQGNYVREAYRIGLELAENGVGNPYRFGLIGSSDTHVAAGAYREEDYWAKVGLGDATAELRGSVPGEGETGGLPAGPDAVDPGAAARTQDGSGRAYRDTTFQLWGASGLAGIWAEENTREALFDAMRRRETFGTSGPRIRVRFFAGTELEGVSMDAPDYLEQAYSAGVPMGGDIYGSGNGNAPVFNAWAVRDPLDAPLQRIQIVKGWLNKDGVTEEQVFDIACSDGLAVDPETHRCPDNGADVDIETCAIRDDVGADELKTTWTDPAFNPGEPAFYYVRVLQNPTCRWSTWDAIRSNEEPRWNLPTTIQDRAWSSPIWYNPRSSGE